LQKKFDKGTKSIKPEHEQFVKERIREFKLNREWVESGARYSSDINQGYRVFRKDNDLFIEVHPNYYLVKID
jgi:hypothetical protein